MIELDIVQFTAFLKGAYSIRQWRATTSDITQFSVRCIMDSTNIILLLLALAMIYFGRFLNAKSFRSLPEETQLKLRNDFKSVRGWTSALLLALAVAYFALQDQQAFDKPIVTLAIFIAILLIILFRAYWNHRQVARFDLPATYRRTYLLVTLLHLSATALMLYVVYPR